MEAIRNQVVEIISNIHQNRDIEEIAPKLTSLLECVKNESDDMISDIKDLRYEVNDLISDLKDDISTLQKKIDSLNVEIDNNNQYEHGDGLVISGDIIPHGTANENCKDIVLNLFWHHLNINLGEDELSISHRIGEKPINGVDNRKIFLKPTKKELTHRIFYATCELNPPFYINHYIIHTRRKIDYIIRQLKINYPNKIIRHYSCNNGTCILYNTRDITSNDINSPSMMETDNRTIHITIKTLGDLEKFISLYLNSTIDLFL